MIRVRYNPAPRRVQALVTQAPPWGADIALEVTRNGARLEFSVFSSGIQVTVNSVAGAEQVFPVTSTTLLATDQDKLASVRALWAPDDEVTIEAWVDDSDGRQSDSVTFTVPRPSRPFPSWSWLGGRWEPPVPQPAGEVTWNEGLQQWVLA